MGGNYNSTYVVVLAPMYSILFDIGIKIITNLLHLITSSHTLFFNCSKVILIFLCELSRNWLFAKKLNMNNFSVPKFDFLPFRITKKHEIL